MTFSEIEYKRVDLAALREELSVLLDEFRKAPSFEEAERVFLYENIREGETIRSMRTLAQIRRDIDTRDKFYDEEVRFYNREMPLLKPLFQEWTQALLDSPFRPQFEKKYGNVLFINAELAERSFVPELVEDIQRENELVSRYTKLIASAQIPFDGKVLNLSQLGAYRLSADDEVRRAAWRADGAWFAEHSAELDEIYDELVKVRDGMGRKLGYNSYTPLGYDRMLRNCYTEADVEKFRIAVQEYVVPLCKRIYMNQAKRIGFEFPMSYADKDLSFRSGNPKPVGDAAQVLDHLTTFFTELSPETKEFWEKMIAMEMLDVESKAGKAGGGYCTAVEQARMPFIFANCNGTANDIRMTTHEAGHAFAGYLNRDRVPADLVNPSLEACEVHSMTMEFFANGWSELFFGEDDRKARYSHLTERLALISYGTMVDHFQHIMYEYPEFGPQERHMVWQELLGIYMPWLRPDDIPFYGEGKAWQRQSHIYMRPFYYIDYVLAQTVALDFWARMQEDRDAAWQTFLEYTKLGGSLVFTDLLAQAGLDSPFEERCLRSIAVKVKAFLDDFDLTGIE